MRNNKVIDIIFQFNAREYQHEMAISYLDELNFNTTVIVLDCHNPYPGVKLDIKQVEQLIEFLKKSLVASQVKELDWNSRRGISIPITK